MLEAFVYAEALDFSATGKCLLTQWKFGVLIVILVEKSISFFQKEELPADDTGDGRTDHSASDHSLRHGACP